MGYLKDVNDAVQEVLSGNKVIVIVEKDLSKLNLNEVLKLEEQGCRYLTLDDVVAEQNQSETIKAPAVKEEVKKQVTRKKSEAEPIRKSKIDVPKALALRAARWSDAQIADEFGCTVGSLQSTIYKYKKENGGN